MKKISAKTAVALLCLSFFLTLATQPPVSAVSVQVQSGFSTAAVDGSVSANEWSKAFMVQLQKGFLFIQNDLNHLFLLVDLTSDTYPDPPLVSAPWGDYFWLAFDINSDHLITPNVDILYAPRLGTYNLAKSYFLGPGVTTSQQPTISHMGEGFGTSPRSATPHRIWEFGIDLNEIQAAPEPPFIWQIVRLGLRTYSQNPYFNSDIPASFVYDFSNLIEVYLPPAPTGLYNFYLMTNSGVMWASSGGGRTNLINAYGGSNTISTLGDKLYIRNPSNGVIMIHNLEGKLLGSITPALAARDYFELTALPQGRFALSNNANDKVYFINSAGTLLATGNIRSTPDGTLQSLCGIVVGNKLVLSEDGQKRIIQFDLTTYARTVLRDLSGLPESWLGSITYANGRYYVCTAQSIYYFTSSTSPIVKVANVPEYNIVGIAVLDSYYAYVALNYAGKIYMVNLATGTCTDTTPAGVPKFNYPKDMASTTGVIFTDGFESGNFVKWTGTSVSLSGTAATAKVSGSRSFQGMYSAYFHTPAGHSTGSYTEWAYCYKTMTSQVNLYTRGYYYVSQSGLSTEGSTFYMIRIKAGTLSSSTEIARAGWRRTGGVVKWFVSVRSGTSWSTTYSASSPSLSRWYHVQLHWVKSSTGGKGELWVNGVLVAALYGKNTAYYGNAMRVEFGLGRALNSGANSVYLDSCTISNVRFTDWYDVP